MALPRAGHRSRWNRGNAPCQRACDARRLENGRAHKRCARKWYGADPGTRKGTAMLSTAGSRTRRSSHQEDGAWPERPHTMTSWLRVIRTPFWWQWLLVTIAGGGMLEHAYRPYAASIDAWRAGELRG